MKDNQEVKFRSADTEVFNAFLRVFFGVTAEED